MSTPRIITKQLQKVVVRKRSGCDYPTYINQSHHNLMSEYATICQDWCISTFGVNPSYDVPYIEVVIDDTRMRRYRMYGEYDSMDNVIILRIRGHRTWKAFTNTVIHEYTHYLQSKAWYERYWVTLSNTSHASSAKTTYDNHPYEQESTYVGGLYADACARWSYYTLTK